MSNVLTLTRHSASRAERNRKTTLDDLPFVGRRRSRRKNELPRCFWHNVTSTGDWRSDQELGSRYAYLALQAIKRDDFAPLLGWIVRDMIAEKCPEHIVVGFFQTVADVCLGYHQIPAQPLANSLKRR